MSWRRTALVAVGAAASVFFTACSPTAESIPMPVVIRSTDTGGWEVVAPVCSADGSEDGIASFDLFGDGGEIENRGARDDESRRLVRLVVDPKTIRDGSFNRAEVRVVSRKGNVGDPASLDDVFVSTARGFAEWDMADIDLSGGQVWVVRGRDDPVEVSEATADRRLSSWCSSR